MNTNKIIFAVLGWIILFLIIMLVMQLNSSTQPNQVQRQSGNFSVWILDQDINTFNRLIADFKDANPEFERVTMNIESFFDSSIYYDTIVSAIWSGTWPDVFLLNNKEYSPLSEHTIWINPSSLSPVDFRRNFHPVFWEDLIVWEWTTGRDFVRWVPTWYQVPVLVYDRRSFPRTSELSDWGRFTLEMSSSAERSSIAPLAIGDGTSVTRTESIFLSFLAQEWVSDISQTQNSHTRQAFAQYRSAGEIGTETYMSLARRNNQVSDIEHFTERKVSSVLIYPSDIQKIQDIGYNLNMMFASPFPRSEWKSNAVAINYNYFSIYQNTQYYNIAESFLTYLASERGQRKYIELFPYILPAHSVLALELENRNLDSGLNITYGNLIDSQTELISFDVWRNSLFSSGIRDILQRENWFDSSFQILKWYIMCALSKYRDFDNLSRGCSM